MSVEYQQASSIAVVKGVATNSQLANVVKFYTGSVTYDDEPSSKYATVTVSGKTQRVMLCIAVSGTVAYDDSPCLYSTVSGHRCLNITEPTATETPDDIPNAITTLTISGKNYPAIRCILINKTPTYDGVSSTCTFTDDNGKIHTAQLVNQVGSGSIEKIVKGVPPLTLDNAIADSLQYVKAFGGTEQRNLPDGYIQRQFIYMMDGSYLLTDVVPTSDMRIEMDFQTTSVPNSGVTYFGARDITAAGSGFRFGYAPSKYITIDGFGERYESSVVFSNNTRYKFVWDNGVGKMLQGSTEIVSNTFTPTETVAYPVAINALNDHGTFNGNTAGIYLYSFKAWNAQGVLVADYVPAIQRGTVPVVGFYDTVSGTFKTATAGTFAAGGEAVPTPDTPMDIVSNNGVLKASVNEFDANAITNGYFYNENLVWVANASVYTTDYMKTVKGKYTLVLGNVTTLSTTVNVRVNLFNANKEIQSQVVIPITPDTTEYTYEVDIPNGISYVRISTNPSYVVVSSFNNSKPVYADGVVETIGLYSANHSNLLAPNMIHQGTIQSGTGAIIYATTRCYTDAIKVNAGKTIWVSAKSGTPPIFGSARLYSTSAINTYTGEVFGTAFSFGDYTGYSFTATSDTYIRFLFLQNADFTPADVVDAQATIQSTTPTTYEPYYDGGTATAEMLLSLGDYTDEQEIISGVVTRKLGVKVLDGTESTSTIGGIFRLNCPDIIPEMTTGWQTRRICTHGVCGSASTTNSNIEIDTGHIWFGGGFGLTESTGPQFLANQYAAGTPVIIVYPLATETTDTVTGQPMNTTAGDNILEITQASLNGLEVEVKYEQ